MSKTQPIILEKSVVVFSQQVRDKQKNEFYLKPDSAYLEQAIESDSESDKFIRSKIEQPKAGPQGETQGWVE